MANEHNASPRIVAALSAALLTGVAPAALASDGALAETPLPAVREIPDFRFPSWIELGGYFGTNGTSRGELTLWTPLTQGPDNLTFFELRTKVFEGSALEGNFALGYRRQMPSGFNLGAWGGLDVRGTRQDNTFWQLSGGLEALSERIDARINAYWPLTGPQAGDGSTAQVQLQGNNIFMTGGAEVALRGVDAEIGRRADFGPATLAGYFGGYYFDHPDAFEDIAGGKARAELFFDDFMTSGGRLSFDYEFSYDDVREARHEVGLRLRLPIGGNDRADLANLSPQQLRMMDGLERDTDIVIGRSARERVEDALTGTDFDRVAFIEDGDTATDVSAQAGDNSLLIQNVDLIGAQTLNGDQTLQGRGSTIAVRGLRFGGLGAFTAPGTPAPSITNITNSAVLTIEGTNTHVAGLTITGDGNQGLADNDGIHVDQPSFFGAFTQLSISYAGGTGVHIGGEATVEASGNVTVTRSGLFVDVEIDNVGGDGVYIGGGAAIVKGNGNANTNLSGTFTNVTISETGREGVRFSGGGSTVYGDGTATTNRVGTFLDTVPNVTISGTGGSGVVFAGRGSRVYGAGAATTTPNTATTNRVGTFTNVEISDTYDSGVVFAGAPSVVDGDGTANTDFVGTFTNVTISGTGNDGVRFSGGGSRVDGDGTATTNRVGTFTNVEISDTYNSGVVFTGAGSYVYGDGIATPTPNTATTNRVGRFTNVEIIGTGENGVVVTGGGGGVGGVGTVNIDHEGTFTNVEIRGADENGVLFADNGDVTADFTNVIFLGDIGSGAGTALLGADGVTVTASGAISDQTTNSPAVCAVSNGGEFEGTATVDGTPLVTANCP